MAHKLACFKVACQLLIYEMDVHLDPPRFDFMKSEQECFRDDSIINCFSLLEAIYIGSIFINYPSIINPSFF